MKQVVERKKLSAIGGIALVVGIIALILLMNILVTVALPPLIGYKAASIAFWVFGFALAFVILRVFVMGFIYELGEDVLRLTRKYGKRERHIEDIYLSRLMFVGAPEEAKRRYPNAARVKALRSERDARVVALVYRSADKLRMALIQPSEQLLEALNAHMKK